jgi:hypothetical protein
MMFWVEVLLRHPVFSSEVMEININSNVGIEIEPIKNLTFQTGFSYRTLESASDILV